MQKNPFSSDRLLQKLEAEANRGVKNGDLSIIWEFAIFSTWKHWLKQC
jgi:hypothetical protein